MEPKPMDVDTLWKAAVRFLICYGLLIAPWPRWNEVHAAYYRGVCSVVFSHLPGEAVIRFDKNLTPVRPALSTAITLGNRSKVDAAGLSPAVVLQADTRSIAWTPVAFLLALVFAAPVPWTLKLRNAARSLILVHLYILLITAFWLLNRASEVSLWKAEGWTEQLTQVLEYTFIEQIGASFVVPAVIFAILFLPREQIDI